MLKGQIDTDNNGTLDLNRVTSPGTAGSQYVQMMTMSYRDADADGLENNFDTCPWQSNTQAQDPLELRPDTDMLDSVCDQPGSEVDDQDGDGYLNSQDWCPQANPATPREDNENAVGYNTARRTAPRQDSIGDDCDSGAAAATIW
jgi:hypothetical protein